MYTYEVLYSKFGTGRSIKLFCLGEKASPFKVPVTDYVSQIIIFSSEKPLNEIFDKYFKKYKKEKVADREKITDPFEENFKAAISLASNFNYATIKPSTDWYVVPCLSSGRIIKDEEMDMLYENFPCSSYVRPKELAEKYDWILLL